MRAADADATPFEVWNPLLPATILLADAYLRNLTLRSFAQRVASAVEPEVAEPLRAMQMLHGLRVVREDLAWHLDRRLAASRARAPRRRAP